jgi:hypothetical protein
MGDASPSYLSSAIAAEQISRTLPQAKIIFSLRDPAHRAISHYFHQIKRVGDEKRDSAEVFSEENIAKTTQIFQELGYDIETLQNNAFWHTLRYFFEGLYGIHIAKWQALTVAENLLVLNYHRLETEPESYVKSIFHFLGLDMPASLEINKVYANEYPDLPIEIINRLKAFFEPYNQTLFKLLGVKEHWF